MSEIEVDGRALRFSNLDKVLWPRAGFTKGELVDYYRRVAAALLPHLAERPVTLARFPDGVDRYGWYQTNCRGRPDWLPTRRIRDQEYCLLNDLPALLWAANMGAIELHPFLARSDRLHEPEVVVFDLDPGPPAGIVECCRVALRLRDTLAAERLASFPKTSGSLGLHVYVPLNSPAGYGRTKPFARLVARTLAEQHPDSVVDEMPKRLRAGKILLDWGQNDAAKSTVAPYSLRAMERPTVSTPLRWEEVEHVADERRSDLLAFSPRDVLNRLETLGELFEPVLTLKQALPG
ncbi:MAG TPA: non-homologous end-joining DNA ligase [Gaiellaceae bacterium]|nr:non-homologous end-joining DNA ligase [Gaiellaceae bacterium]